MKLFGSAAFISAAYISTAVVAIVASATTCAAGIIPIPTARLDPAASRGFDEFIANHEAENRQKFEKGGALWMDAQGEDRKVEISAGRTFTESQTVTNVPGGQIRKLFGAVYLPNTTLQHVLATLQNYGKYSEYYSPDIAEGSSKEAPDSKPAAKHFQVFLQMVQTTAWFDIAFDTSYDSRYILLGNGRAEGTSRSNYIREYKDAHQKQHGTLPEGADHGFLWRTYTSWHFRERDGGVDLELNSFSLSRPVPPALGWWANRTAKSAVEKMINSTAVAVRRNNSNSSD